MKAMLEVDEQHWWYRGRRRIIRAELERLALPAGAVVLDAGCGSGRTLEELNEFGEVRGVELDPEAAEVARGRGYEVEIGRLEELPWADDDVRPDHVPRRDRAHARRSGHAARAAAGVQARGVAAGDGAGLSGAVVAAR